MSEFTKCESSHRITADYSQHRSPVEGYRQVPGRYIVAASLVAAFTLSGLTETDARSGTPPPSPTACTPSTANRPLKSGQQLYGATLDDVSNISGELDSLKNLPHMPATRIVFDKGTPASSYVQPIQTFYPISYIMGEIADSSYMSQYTVNSITTQANNLVSTLGQCVDIWEIGNEVNGNWLLSNTNSAAQTMAKIKAMYYAVANSTQPMVSKTTALTFFYEGEPRDPNNCIATDNGGNNMFTWIQTNFLTNPTVDTEAVRTGVNYVLISWYPDQCNNLQPNWPVIFEKLASIFPNASVGFGELGTANPQNGSQYEIDLINQFYPAVKQGIGWPGTASEVAYMRNHYIGGYFWWYFAEEMVPRAASVLYPVISNAMQ